MNVENQTSDIRHLTVNINAMTFMLPVKALKFGSPFMKPLGKSDIQIW